MLTLLLLQNGYYVSDSIIHLQTIDNVQNEYYRIQTNFNAKKSFWMFTRKSDIQPPKSTQNEKYTKKMQMLSLN